NDRFRLVSYSGQNQSERQFLSRHKLKMASFICFYLMGYPVESNGYLCDGRLRTSINNCTFQRGINNWFLCLYRWMDEQEGKGKEAYFITGICFHVLSL